MSEQRATYNTDTTHGAGQVRRLSWREKLIRRLIELRRAGVAYVVIDLQNRTIHPAQRAEHIGGDDWALDITEAHD